MSSVAFTRFFNNENLLRNWLKYYSRYFDKLIVLGCELSDPTRYILPDHSRPAYDNISELLKEYSVEYTDTNHPIYSTQMYQTIFDKQKELFNDFEWVFYSDMDEIVVADPDKFKDLNDFMDKCLVEQTFCEGYNVFRHPNEEVMDWSKPILEQRGHWGKHHNGSYNKPCLSKIPTEWVEGFHYVKWMYPDDVKSIENTGLYLFHLKGINQIGADLDSLPLVEIPSKFKGAF